MQRLVRLVQRTLGSQPTSKPSSKAQSLNQALGNNAQHDLRSRELRSQNHPPLDGARSGDWTAPLTDDDVKRREAEKSFRERPRLKSAQEGIERSSYENPTQYLSREHPSHDVAPQFGFTRKARQRSEEWAGTFKELPCEQRIRDYTGNYVGHRLDNRDFYSEPSELFHNEVKEVLLPRPRG